MDAHRIQTLEQLRAVVGQPHPMTPQKVLDRLDEVAIRFLERSPMVLWSPETWPEPVRISFGRQLARKLELQPEMAERIDQAVAEDYKTGL